MLYVIEVGHNQASDRYIRNKKKAVEDAGMQVGVINLPEDATTETIIDTINDCTWEEDCNAIMVQLPLPDHVDKNKVFKNIPPALDIDGLNPGSSYKPLTPCAIMRWFRETGVSLAGKNIVIFGKSDLVGKPLALMCMEAGATVTVCNSKTSERTKQRACFWADIIVSAVGKAFAVMEDYIPTCLDPKIIVDVGINKDENGRLCGDVSPKARELIEKNGGMCTPVPGGVGLWTVQELVIRLGEMEAEYGMGVRYE